jgi:DNA (cytosine-5)-methyltransferase 1
VTRWAEALRPGVILVENVTEFATWGPVDANGRPLASRKGEVFRAWKSTLEAIGYRVDHRVLCAADYGDPTTRRRLFIQAVRGKRKITWPDATHAPGDGDTDLLGARRPWVPARDIIDWTLPGQSIFERKRPLAPKTMRRIWAGLEKFGLNPCIITMEHGGGVRDAARPLPTVTCAKGGAMGVATPFLVKLRGPNTAADIEKPAPTITAGGGHLALAEPFIIEYYGNGGAASVNKPLHTVRTHEHIALARPVIRANDRRYELDILFRMLHPHELAAAQGFRHDYKFTGSKTQQVRQIGNAVPRRLARALVLAALSQQNDIAHFSTIPMRTDISTTRSAAPSVSQRASF